MVFSHLTAPVVYCVCCVCVCVCVVLYMYMYVCVLLYARAYDVVVLCVCSVCIGLTGHVRVAGSPKLRFLACTSSH
eukprot:COSAG02_NODE_36397_length_455_cov_0.696629_1_plen_75_part_10